MFDIIARVRKRIPLHRSLDEQWDWKNRSFPQTREGIDAELEEIDRVSVLHKPLHDRRARLRGMLARLNPVSEAECRQLLAEEPMNGVFYAGPQMKIGGHNERI